MPFDWKSLVIRVAPTLGMALNGPLSGIAISFLASKLFDTPPEDVDAALADAIGAQTPEMLAKLIELDGEFRATLTQLNLKDEYFQDVANAREREMTLRDRTPATLAAAVTGGLFAIIFMLIFVPIPTESMNIVNIMLGSLSTAWMNVIGYYFGSSKVPSVVASRSKK
jgi:hypothetical protein